MRIILVIMAVSLAQIAGAQETHLFSALDELSVLHSRLERLDRDRILDPEKREIDLAESGASKAIEALEDQILSDLGIKTYFKERLRTKIQAQDKTCLEATHEAVKEAFARCHAMGNRYCGGKVTHPWDKERKFPVFSIRQESIKTSRCRGYVLALGAEERPSWGVWIEANPPEDF